MRLQLKSRRKPSIKHIKHASQRMTITKPQDSKKKELPQNVLRKLTFDVEAIKNHVSGEMFYLQVEDEKRREFESHCFKHACNQNLEKSYDVFVFLIFLLINVFA